MTAIPKRRILVIDDNRAIHDDFRKVLCPPVDETDAAEAEFFGDAPVDRNEPSFEIDSAFQGEEGVAALSRTLDESRPYAMAFIDVRMPPGMDGIETAKQLWERYPELQIVICTAHSDYSWQEMIERLGNRDRLLVLKKPFATIEVLQLACALCEKWELTQRARAHLDETERIVEERTRELRASANRLQAEIERREHVEAQLLRAQRLESIGTLASGIAHDLNNMLSPILMGAELLRLRPRDDREELVTMIESSALRAADMIKQVLTFARGIEGERLPLQPKLLVREIEKMIGETFPRLIRLETRIEKDLPLIEGDLTQLYQVLLNLCVNARDAMPDGGTLTIAADRFEVDEYYASMTPGAQAGGYVRLRVSDTGSGIPKHLIEKIFDPFFTTKPVGKGTGLGLSTVIGIVRSHDGFIDLRSESGKGSIFEVFLPTALDGNVSVTREVSAAGPVGNGELILVVDDEAPIRDVMQSVLARHGYRTLVAADGAEAVSVFAQQIDSIDAVLTDVMMPVVDGIALCRALKRIDPEVRIVAATGDGEENRMRELRSLDVGVILTKPFTTCTLLNALADSLRRQMGGALSSDRVGLVTA